MEFIIDSDWSGHFRGKVREEVDSILVKVEKQFSIIWYSILKTLKIYFYSLKACSK